MFSPRAIEGFLQFQKNKEDGYEDNISFEP